MVILCEEYAEQFKISFNGSKSQLLKFCRPGDTYNASDNVLVCGQRVHCQDSAIHLGHTLYWNIFRDDCDTITKKFYKQYNCFRYKCQTMSSQVKNELFNTYCTSFYGVQLCDLNKLHKLHVAYRKCLRNIWNIPFRTHNAILPALAGRLCSTHMSLKRFVKFAKMALEHDSPVIRFVFHNALRKHSNSVFNRNLEHLQNQAAINREEFLSTEINNLTRTVDTLCEETCHTTQDDVKANVLKELIGCRDNDYVSILNFNEISLFINELCLN